MSLEELLKKRIDTQKETEKPIFLSKKQREELEKLQKKEEQERIKIEAQKEQERTAASRNRIERERREERKRLEEERAQFQDQREKEKELELIKQQYLGQEKVKKRVLKPSEKFRFNFDWEVSDDTSRDLNPLYNNPHEAAPLFGRGLRAGIDRREQKKEALSREKELLRSSRSAAGLKETSEIRKLDLQREKEANLYSDMKNEKHWSDKKKEEMTDRDWRIFKEDYNISFKGI